MTAFGARDHTGSTKPIPGGSYGTRSTPNATAPLANGTLSPSRPFGRVFSAGTPQPERAEFAAQFRRDSALPCARALFAAFYSGAVSDKDGRQRESTDEYDTQTPLHGRGSDAASVDAAQRAGGIGYGHS
jgi:hypothetical protein